MNIALSERITIGAQFTGQLREYRSLDEAPEALREQIRKVREAAASAEGGNVIAVTDASCKAQTHHSVEEFPPEPRALYDMARAQHGSK